MNLDGSDPWSSNPSSSESSSWSSGARASTRAQRALVRVLLALRGETRRCANAAGDRARAEALADRIMSELPRSILPLGLAAAVIVLVVCAMPLMRDAVADDASAATPVASVVERGIRENGAALSDGFEALREVVAPFAVEAPVVDEQSCCRPPEEATAPYPRS